MKLLFIIATTVFALNFLWSCVKSNSETVPTLSSHQGEKLLSNHNYIFIDVRTKQEHDTGHIPNSTHISIESLESRIDEIEKYKEKKIVVYCRSGNRSSKGTKILIKYGFEAMNLSGGILQWKGPVDNN
jgi:rhodanese-related sulfurtransferase